MSELLDIPADRPRTGADPRGRWHRVRQPLPAGAPGPAELAATVASALARITGARTVPLGLDDGTRRRTADLAVRDDDTIAALARRVATASASATPPQVWLHTRVPHVPDTGAELVLSVTDTGDALVLDGTGALFEPETVARLAARLARAADAVARGAAVRPADLPLLSAQERRVLDGINDTDAPVPDRSLYALLDERARTRPQDVAVVWSTGRLSFAELFAAAAELAAGLWADGVRPGTLVRLCLPRGPELVVAWLAVLACGAVCVPLDPGYPPERLRALLDSSGDGPVLGRPQDTHPAELGRVRSIDLAALLARAAVGGWPKPLHEAAVDDLAYVIFTSGSTGRPKGVGIEHRSVVNLLHHTAERFGLRAGARMLHTGSPSFDVTVWEIFAPLYAAATVVVHEERDMAPSRLAAFVARHEVDTVFLLSATLAQLDPGRFPGVRTVVTGGDGFGQALVDRWQPGRDFIYVYGPTEATVFQSWHPCVADAAVPPATIGRPLPNLRYQVLDRFGEVAVPGAVGELHIRGAGVGRGYLGSPAHTVSAFYADAEGRWTYRSGDLASYRPDGAIDFRGRADGQVKIRGFRIELGEIEGALAARPGVRAAAAVVHRPAPDADPLIVGYAQPEDSSGHPLDGEGLRAAVAGILPRHMVPAVVVPVESLPYTPNGKIDRRALAALPPRLPEGREPSARPPADEAERRLTALFAEVLPGVEVGPDTDFFLSGGTSLAAAELAAAVSASWGRQVGVRDVFLCPSPARLAGRLGPPAGTAPRAGTAEARGSATEGIVNWLWLERQIRPPDYVGYNVPALFRGEGTVDPVRLERALHAVQWRHPVLRTVVPERGGRPEVTVTDRVAPLEVVRVDGPAELDRAVEERANTPFDLARGPLLRATLFLGRGGEWWLLTVADHIVCDGRSLEILPAEIAAAYDSAALPVPVVADPPQDRERALAHWRELLTPLPDALPLPVDVRRSDSPRTACGNVVADIDAATVRRLRALASSVHAGIFATLAVAVGTVLRQTTGATDVCLGTAVDRRPALRAANALGCYVTTVPVRVDVTPARPVRTVVGAVAEQTFDAMDHGAVPFDELVADLSVRTAPGRHPLFDVWLSHYHRTRVPRAAEDGIGFTGEPVPLRHGKLDLAFLFCEHPDGLRLTLRYDSELYRESTARALADRVVTVLHRLAAAPADASLAVADDGRDPAAPVFAGFRFDPSD
ncbi:amino acid adenylation domain-containing protein [Streptomyces sp. NPDC004658]|uniref:amino acid adenylation domain-containing protein n=1 Tax=Streptomyces sp. NPDC004658 TaxID=3154672 RepID=UPI0033A0051C